MNKFEININEKGYGSVKMNNENLKGVIGVKINSHINEMTTVEIKFVAKEIRGIIAGKFVGEIE